MSNIWVLTLKNFLCDISNKTFIYPLSSGGGLKFLSFIFIEIQQFKKRQNYETPCIPTYATFIEMHAEGKYLRGQRIGSGHFGNVFHGI